MENRNQWPKLSGKNVPLCKNGQRLWSPRQFLEIPENFWKNGILKFWAQNHAQWPKLSGKNAQYEEIGQI